MRFHAAEPFVDIRDEAELRLLAVVDDVDPGLDLALDDVFNGLADGLVVARRVRLAVGHHVRERVGPGQAADMGGDDALAAFFVQRHWDFLRQERMFTAEAPDASKAGQCRNRPIISHNIAYTSYWPRKLAAVGGGL